MIYSDLCDVHVSGHGSREDLKLMLSLTRPKFFIPMHGEYRHLVLHSRIAREMKIPPENIVIVETGRVIEVRPDSIALGEEVRGGHVLVDGLSVGDIGAAVLRDRKHLSRDGFLVAMVAIDRATGEVVADPEILTPRLRLRGGSGRTDRGRQGPHVAGAADAGRRVVRTQ